MEAVMGKFQSFRILFLLAAVFLLAGSGSKSAAAGFEQDLTLGGITFHVASVNEGAVGRVKITLSGPGVDPGPVESRVNGTVTKAEVTDDLDDDGAPELYIYAACPDDVAVEGNHNPYSAPPGAALITIGPHVHPGVVPLVPVGAGQSGSAVVIGPGVTARADGVTARMFPIFPIESPEYRTCIHELKFVLVNGKNGKTLQLVSR